MQRNACASPLLAAAACVALASCGAEPSLVIEPPRVSLFGQHRVHLTARDVRLADLAGLRLRLDTAAVELEAAPDGGVWATVQGSAAAAGPVDVVAEWDGGERRWPGAFTYTEPVAPSLRTWMAIGASWTQGIQANGISPHSQRMGPAAQLARAAGAYLGLPLLQPWLMPPSTPEQVNGDCSVPAPSFALDELLEQVKDPETGAIEPSRARLDPDLPVRNVAIGGYTMAQVLEGGSGFGAMVENVVTNPHGDLAEMLSKPPRSQVALVEEVRPDIVVSTDLYFNDVGVAVLRPDDDIDLEALQAVEAFKADADALAARIAGASKHAFFGNMPHVDFLPRVAELRAMRRAAGESRASFDEKVAAVNAHVDAMNAAFAAAIAPYPNLHLVDVAAGVAQLSDGLQVGGQQLLVAPFGGLFSLDNIHLSDTGYAVCANIFIEAINAELSAAIPRIDLAQVLAQDRESPEALRGYPNGARCVPAAAGR